MNGQLLEARRKELGLTQDELAAMVGVGQATISRLEANQQNATINLLERVAAALTIPVSSLMAQPAESAA